jgi:Ca-activated chloride channel family protein
VTALYEVVPAGLPAPGPTVDALRYQEGLRLSPSGEASGELLTVKLRWKEPDGDASRPSALPFVDGGAPFDAASGELRFAASVAAFGLVLRDSPNKGSASLDLVREIAAGALGTDDGGWRKEFLSLVEKAATLKR